MAKIRDDLEGVTWVTVDGDLTMLSAGDEIPEGVTVGDHLLAGDTGPNYKQMQKAKLQAEIDERNKTRTGDNVITVAEPGNKPQLVAALEADDAAKTD